MLISNINRFYDLEALKIVCINTELYKTLGLVYADLLFSGRCIYSENVLDVRVFGIPSREIALYSNGLLTLATFGAKIPIKQRALSRDRI